MTDEEWQAYAQSGKLEVAREAAIKKMQAASAELSAHLDAKLKAIKDKFELETAKFENAKRKFYPGSEKLILASERFARQTKKYDRAVAEHPYVIKRVSAELSLCFGQEYFDLVEADLNAIGLSQDTNKPTITFESMKVVDARHP